MREVSIDDRSVISRYATLLWGAATFVLCVWVASRMGLFDLTTRVTIDGRTVDVLNSFAEVDHPFHSTRAATLLESLRDGEVLRWMGQHQGGYPVEFYPLGIAWLDVAIWAISLGSFSILAAHKVAIILVFLLPSLSYWLLARGDRIHPGVAFLATAIHFSVPGHWLNGGYEELVGWGLVTNVAGASLALLTSVALARFVIDREFGMGVLATLAAAGGAVTNPRSLFALVVAALAILVISVVYRGARDRKTVFIDAGVRIAAVGGIAVLLAAPVILALFRYNALYFFLHYEFYEPLSEYWGASATAVTQWALLLAIAGAVLAFVPRLRMRLDVSRGIALAGVFYVLLTLWVATATIVPPLVEQLEAPRLMPFQRQVMIWFGALAVGVVVRQIGRFTTGWGREALTVVVLGGLALFVFVAHVRPLDFVPQEQVALREVSLTGNADHAEFELAIERADEVLPDGTSIFVVGNRDDWWHQQLWAPSYSDARFYYDDWMWYWHQRHEGPYDPANGYWMPNPTDALEGGYLDANGVGVVVVSDMWVPSGVPPRESARSNPRLQPVETFGAWDVYTVDDPSSLVTNGDMSPVSIGLDNQRIRATFENGDGTVVVRQNWFPRWEAIANGEPVDITRRDDGYMEIQVPPGAVELELVYGVTMLDWAGRAASVTGIVILGVGIWRGPALLRKLDDEPHAAQIAHHQGNVTQS